MARWPTPVLALLAALLVGLISGTAASPTGVSPARGLSKRWKALHCDADLPTEDYPSGSSADRYSSLTELCSARNVGCYCEDGMSFPSCEFPPGREDLWHAFVDNCMGDCECRTVNLRKMHRRPRVSQVSNEESGITCVGESCPNGEVSSAPPLKTQSSTCSQESRCSNTTPCPNSDSCKYKCQMDYAASAGMWFWLGVCVLELSG
ncbi:MAG: hypothetical protein M1832_000451 [Thelocarpon impressellum]|nr:MAG: hypothetical protein M1832_000451 [Thelocarpon impressellum]